MRGGDSVILGLLAACDDYYVDYDVPRPLATAADTTPDEPADSGPALATEACNGVDDDGDGAVDEDFADDDANGRADCMDVTCPDAPVSAAGAVPLLPVCVGQPNVPPGLVDDPWDLGVQWKVSIPGDAFVTAVVGNLNDDDGDGVVSAGDVPDVVLVTLASHLLVLDGRTGALEWRVEGHVGAMAPALGDVDGDGRADVVAFGRGGAPIAYRGDGTELWEGPPGGWVASSGAASVVDLDGDGRAEVLADDLVLDGATGSLRFRLPKGSDALLRSVAAADLDLDGDEELFYDAAAFDSDGSPLWRAEPDGALTNWPVVVQADADDQGEIAFVTDSLVVYDADGTELARADLDAVMGAAPPCAGDFDGDDDMEIAVATHYGALSVYELDGTVDWSWPLPPNALGAGCTGFDMDGDGALEILYPGTDGFFVFDGGTGEVLAEWPEYRNTSPVHGAIVADVDADGHAEIVVATSGSAPDAWAYVLEHDGAGWPAAGPLWSNLDFSMTNVESDGAVPQSPEPSWLRDKVYRSRTAQDGSLVAPDLYVRLEDVCVADCTYGPVRVTAEVGNQGLTDVPAGLVLDIYAVGPERKVAEATLPSIPAGTRLADLTFDLSPADVGATGFVARVNEDLAVYECDPSNDEDAWSEVFCP